LRCINWPWLQRWNCKRCTTISMFLKMLCSHTFLLMHYRWATHKVVVRLLNAIISSLIWFGALPLIKWICGILSLGNGSLISGCSQELRCNNLGVLCNANKCLDCIVVTLSFL
jgi:hypothetical protein